MTVVVTNLGAKVKSIFQMTKFFSLFLIFLERIRNMELKKNYMLPSRS